MITKNDSHLDLYTKANNILREHDILQNEITNIDEYFTYIEDLKNLIEQTESTDNPVDPEFLILPSDEPIFEIDANSRGINIKGFNHGVGVQGDEVAEVLYFSIDRYFDIQDLYNKEIFIQWEAPNRPGATGGGDQGLSITINKSLAFLPGKVVFGWPIGKEITAIPGQVKYSVRFYERGFDSQNKPILTYSFSTTTSTIKIIEGLDFDISDESNITQKIIDKKALIYNNLKNSETTNVSIPALEIAFKMFYPKIKEDGTTLENQRSLPEKVNLDENNEYSLIAQAHFNPKDGNYEYGAGNITYNWIFKDKIGTINSKADTPYYKDTKDLTRDKSKLYYYKDIKGKYILYTQEEFPISTTYGQIYERYGSLIAKDAGYYQVEAVNRYGSDTEEILSDICLIPFANQPEFIIANPNIIIPENSSDIINLEATVIATDGGLLNIQWKESNENNHQIATDIIGANDSGLEEITTSINVNGSNIDSNGKYYFINASNNKNNDITTNISQPIRITYPMIKPTFNYYINGSKTDNFELYLSDADITSGVILQIEPIGGRYDNELTYQWQRNTENIDNATNASYTITDFGNYKCNISISYNGVNEVIASSTFFISKQ